MLHIIALIVFTIATCGNAIHDKRSLQYRLVRRAEEMAIAEVKPAGVVKQVSTKAGINSSESSFGLPAPLTTINYGVYLKKFYGLSFGEGGWRGDIIVALSWQDQHASTKSDGLSPKEAESAMWMPDIVVTNLNFASSVEISSTVKVENQTVTKVSRLLVKLVADLNPTEFPFDSQMLKVRLASSKYMSDKVNLVPMPESEGAENPYNGVSEVAFGKDGGAWTLESYSAEAIEETDGMLKKSRGEFILKVNRNWQIFISTLLLPEILLVLIAWTAFFFPMMPPFAMPKVASTMIPLLAMLAFMARTAKLMPSSSAWSWVSVYEEVCVEMVVFAIVANIVIETTMYVSKNEDLAKTIQFETRILYPIVTAALVLGVFSQRHASEFSALAWSLRTCWICLTGIYCWQAKNRNAPASPVESPTVEPPTVEPPPSSEPPK